jgi:hypothetical protein
MRNITQKARHAGEHDGPWQDIAKRWLGDALPLIHLGILRKLLFLVLSRLGATACCARDTGVAPPPWQGFSAVVHCFGFCQTRKHRRRIAPPV